MHPCALILFVVLSSCGRGNPSPKLQANPAETPRLARVSNRPGNPDGVVFIVEYHRISKEEARWDRSINAFKRDLERFYKMGFRPVTVSQFLDSKMSLPPGASPVVFTFDDSTPSQFRYTDSGDPDFDGCAVGIWLEFSQKHPDFPLHATFFILPPNPWGDKSALREKFRQIKEWGSEIGSHTMTHPKLSRLADEQVKAELAGAIDFAAAYGFRADTIALPFGISPKNDALLKGFDYKGRHYSHRAAFLVGANPAPMPGTKGFNPYRIPRIQGIEGDYGITYWLNKVQSGEVKPYVQP